MVSGFGGGPTLQARLSLKTDDFNKGLKSANSGLKGFSDRLSAARVPLAAAGAALTGVGLLSIKAASDLTEAANKADVTFGQSAKTIEKFAGDSARNFGISTRAAFEYSGTLGTILNASGLAQEASAGMSVELVKLAADLASFNNIPIDIALEKIRSGLVGEIEPLRTVGVLLNANAVEAKALELGLVDVNGELTEAAKVQARYALILEQTSAQQGDFNRTSDSLANKTRIVRAQFENLAGQIGERLLPAAEKLADWAFQALDFFGDLPEPVKTFGVALGVVAAGFIGLGLVIPPAIGLMTTFGVVSNIALAGIPLLIAGIIAAGAFLIMKWDEVVEFMRGSGGWILAAFGPIGVAAKLTIDNFDEIKEAARSFFNFIVDSINEFINKTNDIIRAMNAVAGVFGQRIPEIEYELSRWEDKTEKLALAVHDTEEQVGQSLERTGSDYEQFANKSTAEMERINAALREQVENVRHLSQEEADAIGLGVTRKILMNQIYRNAREGDLEHEQAISGALIDIETDRTAAAIRGAQIRMTARQEEFNTLHDLISGLPSRFGPGMTAQGTLDPIKGFFDKDRADRIEADRKADELQRRLNAGEFSGSGLNFQDAEGNVLTHEQQIRAEIERLREISGGNLSGPGLDNFARLMVERAGAAPPMLPGMQGGIGAGGIAAGGGAGGVSVTNNFYGDIHTDEVERIAEAVNEGIRRGMIQEQEVTG